MRGGNVRHTDWQTTIIGRARVTADRLALETNSVARADDLKRLVEDACGALLRYRIREHADPRAGFGRAAGAGASPAPQPPEMAEFVRAYKERHYHAWADESLPVLRGKSPRQAMRTASGRQRVDLLLKDMENHESRLPEQQRYDFSQLRRELGLDS